MGIVISTLKDALEREQKDLDAPFNERVLLYITEEDWAEWKQQAGQNVKELNQAIKILTEHGIS